MAELGGPARLVVFEGQGHTSFGSGNECLDARIADYLVDLVVPPTDLDLLRQAEPAPGGARIGSDDPSDLEHRVAELPKIVSVDDHVVEPRAPLADVAAGAVPGRRDPGSSAAGSARCATSAAAPTSRPSTPDGPQADCWVYEDLVYINKRHVAAVGFDRDDMTMSPITYDEMRPGCYDPKARVADMEMNWVEASLSFPSFPRFCGQTFLEASDRELAEACVYAYNDWMVEEWCGDSGGALIPLCLIPLWDADLAAAEVRRNAERGVRAGVLQRDPAASRAAEHPLGVLGSVLRGVRARPEPSCACTSARAHACRRRRPTRPSRSPRPSASATR